MEQEFSFGAVTPAGFLSPAEIVVSGNMDDPDVLEAIQRLQLSLVADPHFPTTSPDGGGQRGPELVSAGPPLSRQEHQP